MKTFLMMAACAAGLMASAALPARADGQGQGDHDRPAASQPLYVHDNGDPWTWQDRRYRSLPYPGNGTVCRAGWNGGWGGNGGWGRGWDDDGRSDGDWNGGWDSGGWSNRGWGGYQPNGGWQNGYGQRRPQLPRQAIAYCVQQQRFTNIKDIDFDDGFYKVYARDPYGRKVKLLVDPYTGGIVRVKYR